MDKEESNASVSHLLRFDQEYQDDLMHRMADKTLSVGEWKETVKYHSAFVKNELRKHYLGETIINIDDMRQALDYLLHLKSQGPRDKADIKEQISTTRFQLDNMIKNYEG